MPNDTESVTGRHSAVMRLAKRFRDTMEHMDPTGSGDWEHVSEEDKRFYCAVVEIVLDDEALVLEALKESRPQSHSS